VFTIIYPFLNEIERLGGGRGVVVVLLQDGVLNALANHVLKKQSKIQF
jgi:hypothetical protein